MHSFVNFKRNFQLWQIFWVSFWDCSPHDGLIISFWFVFYQTCQAKSNCSWRLPWCNPVSFQERDFKVTSFSLLHHSCFPLSGFIKKKFISMKVGRSIVNWVNLLFLFFFDQILAFFCGTHRAFNFDVVTPNHFKQIFTNTWIVINLVCSTWLDESDCKTIQSWQRIN